MRDVFVETALNGPWGRAGQPRMPITVQALITEGVACAEAGAAVIHLHVYDPATGAQWEDPEAYAAVITGIRARADVIVYPTLPLAGAPGSDVAMTPAERFATVEALAQAGLLEWAVIDPGSAQFTDLAALPDGPPGFLYRNSEADLRHGLTLARRYGFHPSYAIYEPGFLRLGAALARAMGAPQPIYRFMFSDGFSFGFPPRPWALDAYLALLAECHPGAPWMVAGLQVDLDPVFDTALARGGHVRVGLEDAAFGCAATNLDLTRAAVARLRAQGYTPGVAPALRRYFST
jgi:uncharacterized protein (DUF849 family)